MQRKFISLVAILFLATIGSASVARAATVTYEFSGSVYLVSDTISSAISVGDAVSGNFTFEDSAVAQSFSPGGVLDPSISYYPWVLTSFNVQLGSYSASLGTVGEQRIFVINDDANGMDRFLVEMFSPASASVGGLLPYGLFLSFQDNFGTVLQDGSLPFAASKLNNFGSRTGALDFIAGDAQNRATFSVSEAHAVPEPLTGSLLIGGLLALALSRRFSGRGSVLA